MFRNNTDRLQGAVLIALMGFLTAFSPLSIDMYVPSLPALVHDLHTTPELAQQSMSAFFFGLGFGQFFAGGLSNRYGRLPPLFAGIGLYLAASIACTLAPSIHVLIAARVAQGLGVSATAVTSRAVVRDVHAGREAARVMSYVIMVMAIVPIVAPLVGGQILLAFAVTGAGFFAIIVPLFFAVGSAGVIGANTVAGLLNLFPENAGAGSALFGVFQFGFGAAGAAAAGALYNSTPVAMAGVMTAGIVCAFASWCRLSWLDCRVNQA